MTVAMVTKSAKRERLHQLHFVMSDQLAKYELHICNDILFIHNFSVKHAAILPHRSRFQTKLEEPE